MAASVLDMAGIAPPASYDGVSLVPLLVRGDVGSRMAGRVIPLLRGSWRGAVYGSYKLLRYNKSFSFFDSSSDPEEQRNVYASHKPLARKMWKVADAELERRLAAFKDPAVASNDEAEDD